MCVQLNHRVECNQPLAWQYLLREADNDNALAAGFAALVAVAVAVAGEWKEKGEGGVCGVLQDMTLANKYGSQALPGLLQGVEDGCKYSQHCLGCLHARGVAMCVDHTEAVRLLQLSAEQGHADAEAGLGLCFQRGNGVTMDDAMAVTWLRKAAKRGHVVAQYNLGLLLLCLERGRRTRGGGGGGGEGVQADLAEAMKWFRLSADRGHVGAQCNLGLCLKDGLGAGKWPKLTTV
jgi:TPR repeat protein